MYTCCKNFYHKIKMVIELKKMENFFYTFNQYLRKLHNQKVWRVPLSTGYPCPNRINGKGGCTFCDGISFLPKYLQGYELTLENQLEIGMKFFGERYNVNYFYGYFQANTSTYGEINDLLNKYKIVLEKDKILGLIISTRPDYIYEEIILGIKKLNEDYKKDIWIEMGLQSVYDKTLKRINRNHTFDDFRKAVKIIRDNSDFKIAVHMIIGLPGETPVLIREGIKKLFASCKIDGLKFRLLEIYQGTKMALDYKENPEEFYKFDIDSYASLLCDILELVPQDVVIMRISNFTSLALLKRDFYEENPTRNELVNLINFYFKKRGTRQGSLYRSIA